MIQSNILDMYRVFPFKLETYMKKYFKIFCPRFLCPCLKPAPFSLTQCYTKQALRTLYCVLQFFVEDTQTTLKVCVLLNHSQVIEQGRHNQQMRSFEKRLCLRIMFHIKISLLPNTSISKTQNISYILKRFIDDRSKTFDMIDRMELLEIFGN